MPVRRDQENPTIMDVFRCPICTTILHGWPPSTCPSCRHTIPTDQGILIFTGDPVVCLDGGSPYVGYDEVAGGYSAHQYPEELARQIPTGYGKAIAELLGPGRLVLDIACGPGAYD